MLLTLNMLFVPAQYTDNEFSKKKKHCQKYLIKKRPQIPLVYIIYDLKSGS